METDNFSSSHPLVLQSAILVRDDVTKTTTVFLLIMLASGSQGHYVKFWTQWSCSVAPEDKMAQLPGDKNT